MTARERILAAHKSKHVVIEDELLGFVAIAPLTTNAYFDTSLASLAGQETTADQKVRVAREVVAISVYECDDNNQPTNEPVFVDGFRDDALNALPVDVLLSLMNRVFAASGLDEVETDLEDMSKEGNPEASGS